MHATFRPRLGGRTVSVLCTLFASGMLAVISPPAGHARDFALGGLSFELAEVTTNTSVYFTSMRLKRSVNEWDVEVTVSNRTGQAFAGPLVLLIDNYSGTTGPRHTDGVSSNQFFLDLSPQLLSGSLAPAGLTRARTLSLGYTAGATPKVSTRVFARVQRTPLAVGFTRSLDEVGQPLPGASVTETGPSATAVTQTDLIFGVATLGGGEGQYWWQFSRNGYYPVWRQMNLDTTQVSLVPHPWLARRVESSVVLSPLTGGAVSNQDIVITAAAGAMPQTTEARLTLLNGQTLPAFLPKGWSPLQAFWLELSTEPRQALEANLVPWGPVDARETVTLARWDTNSLAWRALASLSGQGTNALAVSLPGTGAYALVVPDSGPTAPAAATVGSALPAGADAVPNPSALIAKGIVNPSSSPASTVPELVTATADVQVTNTAGPLGSGTLLRGEVSQRYSLRGGSSRLPPVFDTIVVAYQRPGTPGTLHARFPLRPVLLFGPDQLEEGTVHVELFSPAIFTGGILETNGGLVADGGVRLLAAPNTWERAQALELRALNPTNFVELTGTNYDLVSAFELGTTPARAGLELYLQADGVPTNSYLVLARVISDGGLYGLEPRARFRSDEKGSLLLDEPQSGERLPGLTGAGQFVLLRVRTSQGLVKGIARNSAGQATAGLPVTLTGLPWLTLSGPDGSFKLLAPAGTHQLKVQDLAKGDSGAETVTVPADLAVQSAEVAASLQGLQVVTVTPADQATNVNAVTAVTVQFNRPINPATLVGETVQLLGPGNQVVSSTVSLNLANTTVSLLPAASLDQDTVYRLLLSTNIADGLGRTLQGQNQFSFRTVAASHRELAAQLIVYQPGATNVAPNVVADLPGYTVGTNRDAIVVHGTTGAADPGVPVVVVNEASGESTTVISKADGSFTTFINGAEEDFISATFVGLNGSRLYVPVTRQLFDDGSVGLFQQGGTIEAPGSGGTIQLIVPQNALPSRAKFKLDSLDLTNVIARLGGVSPAEGAIGGGALNLNIEGALPTIPVQVRFPVDLTALGYPTNEAPTNVAAVVAAVTSNEDVTAFRVMDQLVFHPDSAATNTSRANRVRLGGRRGLGSGDNEQLAAGFLDTSIGLMLPALGPAALPVQVGFNQVLVPLLFGPRPVVIKGKVAALPQEIAEAVARAGLISQVVNLQTGNDYIDMPVQLVQLMGIQNPLQGPAGVAGQIVQVSQFAYNQQQIRLSKALPGALVTVRLSGGPLNVQPGHLFPGMVYAVSGSDGYFLTVAPAAGANYLVRATHPRFADVLEEPVNPISINPLKGGDLSLSGAVWKNFFFQVAQLDDSPPTLSIGNTPVLPSPGQPAQLVINASHPSARPRIEAMITSVGTNDLLTGIAYTNVQYSLENVTKTDTPNNGARWEGTLRCDKAVGIKLKITVFAKSGPVVIPYQVSFTGPTTPNQNPTIPPPGTNDLQGPLVLSTSPLYSAFLQDDSTITVYFNKPIDSSITNNLSGITLEVEGGGTAQIPKPNVSLSLGQRELYLQYPGLTPGQTYRLTLSGQSVRDLAAQPLDQLPTTRESDSFSTLFRTAPTATAALPDIENGRGSLINGKWAYALDQAAQGNYLLVYDVSTPLKPLLVSRTRLFGAPRDLTLIPNFSYVLNVHDHAIKTNDLLAVVGGDLDARIDQGQGTTVSVRGQYLWVLNLANPEAPQVLASPIVSYRVGSAVTKVRWEPPYLVYQEFGADIQQLGLVNLQELIIGYNSSQAERDAFPTAARRNSQNAGQDNNRDGDYVDEDETLPIPDKTPPEFYGKRLSYVLQNTTQKILDFAVTPSARTVGITLTRGVITDDQGRPNGPRLPPMYRTLVGNGLPLDLSEPTAAMVPFADDMYPRWVTIYDALPLKINGTTVTLAVAIVSINDNKDGTQKLEIIDISTPLQPKPLATNVIDVLALGGNIQSLNKRADGLLELAGDLNVLLLDPTKLAITNVPEGQPHPAILSVVARAGTGTRSLGVGDAGTYVVANGGRAEVVQTAPPLRFVSFPSQSGVLSPLSLKQSDAATLDRLFASKVDPPGLAPARFKPETNVSVLSSLEPPNSALHYYVVMLAPGAAGPVVNLGLESLNPAGLPMSNPGRGFPPVRALSQATQDKTGLIPRPNCGAPIKPLPAYRLSDDPQSTYYDVYLSQPFALVAESISSEDLARTTETYQRQVLLSGYALRAFIDPDQADNAVLGPFAAEIDTRKKRIFPLASATAWTVNVDYLLGNNPPPPNAATPFEDTFGAIMAHSGEVRTPDVDMILPSPNLEIMIVRTSGNQDNYEGPFGVGWDFNYNQRLTVLDPLTFPEGLQLPLVVRDTVENSDIAGTQDVLFNNGEGRIQQFRWISTNMPPEYQDDPLVRQLGYSKSVSDYYLPKPGSFDLLVRFFDGRFERVTPGGVRFRYAATGRLEMIVDRFEQNHHDLTYDSSGHLVRIDDKSVTAPRFIKFGYYRRQGADQDFTSGLDLNTDNAFVEGKICRIVDHSGRDVLYEYTAEGFLASRLGVEVGGENGGYAGRSHTFYTYKDCLLTGILVGESGAPLIAAKTVPGEGGKPVAESAAGTHGNDQFTVPANNSAKTLKDQATSVKMGDESTVERHFDARGYVTQTTVTGKSGKSASEVSSNTVDGLRWYAKYAEGNSELVTYDSGNKVFRSRGNKLKVSYEPGPRGGVAFIERFNYDPRFNLPSGEQLTADGFTVSFQLSADGTYIKSIDYGQGQQRTFTYNAHGQLTTSVDEKGVETTKDYDAATGFCISESFGDVKMTYGYDGSIPSLHGRPVSMTRAAGAPTVLKFNNMMQQVQVARGDLVTLTAYDEFGRGVRHREEVGEGKYWETRLAYDALGFVTNSVMTGIEVNGAPGSATYAYTPDERMRTKTIRRPDGSVQTFEYDERGNCSSWTMGDYKEEFTYDKNNNQLSLKRGGDLIAEWQYDGFDRATNIVQRTGKETYRFGRSYYPSGILSGSTASDSLYGLVQEETIDSIDALGRPLTLTVHGTTISPQFQYTHEPLSLTIKGPKMSTVTKWNTAGLRTSVSTPVMTMDIAHDDAGRVQQVDRTEDGSSYSQTFGFDDLDHQTTVDDQIGRFKTLTPRADGNYTAIKDGGDHTTTVSYTSLGEIERKRRGDGMVTLFKHDVERRLTYEGDPTGGFAFAFDAVGRMTNSTLRGGPVVTYSDFDPRNLPRTMTLPGGGVETVTYDLQQHITGRKTVFQNTAVEMTHTYDALNRVREETYSANSGPLNSASFDYDKAGPLLSATFKEDGTQFSVTNTYSSDASRSSVTYPSGTEVTETRDVSGRLTGISEAAGNILSASVWSGNNLPQIVQIGKTMEMANFYDARGRLTGRRVKRLSDGAVLMHMRYQYDGANNVQVRQYLHRGGRADVFGFDDGNRLAQEQVGVIPTNAAAAGPYLYSRHYNYHADGLDYLTSVAANGPLEPPPFATNWTAHDNFLIPEAVDGFVRAADPLGNVARARLWVRPDGAASSAPVEATLEHDGQRRLFRITRADGLTIENQYQPMGLRYSRKVTQGAQVLSHSAYVYDDAARLLEEYDKTGQQPALIARYYYGTGDSPAAADLWDRTSRQLKRYYYLRDEGQSVVAVADAEGRVVERVWYDAFGQPLIESPELLPPQIESVRAGGSSNALLIVLSEPVLAPFLDPGPGGGIVPARLPSGQGLVSISVNGSNAVTSSVLVPSMTGFKPYSVIQCTVNAALSGSNQFAVTLAAGALSDEWGNSNAQFTATFTVTNAPVGSVYLQRNPGATAPAVVARSQIGSPILFHGQYFDYDSGLLYLRARYYDPYSGMMLEPDPLGYEQSVNLYAGIGNNPVTMRDPTGLKYERKFYNTRGQQYNRVARNARGVNDEVLTLRDTDAAQTLFKRGMGDHNFTAIMGALREYLPPPGKEPGRVSIVIKYQKSEALVRQGVNAGTREQKPEKVSKKSENGQVTYTGEHSKLEKYVPDIDGLWIMVDGQLLDYIQVEAFRGRANEITEELGKAFQRQGERHSGGFSRMWENATHAFKHGFTANLMEEIGMPHYKEGKTRGKDWLENELQAKVKNIPEGMEITLRGNTDSFTLDPIRHVTANESQQVFQRSFDIFHQKLDPKSPLFDQRVFQNVTQELYKGDFSLDYFAIGGGKIGLH